MSVEVSKEVIKQARKVVPQEYPAAICIGGEIFFNECLGVHIPVVEPVILVCKPRPPQSWLTILTFTSGEMLMPVMDPN